MHDETILPVRTKLRISSKSLTRIYYVQDHTDKSLTFLKWIELVLALLCLCFAIPATNAASVTVLVKCLIIILNSLSGVLVMVELSYSYFKKALPVLLQVLGPATNLVLYVVTSAVIYNTGSAGDLIKTLLFLESFAAVMFLVDFVCKIIISAYLYRNTTVKSVADAAVSVYIPSPAPVKPKNHRSPLTATPITYGGTFPIGKDEPPFLPEERNPPGDGCGTPIKGNRHKSVQTAHFADFTTSDPAQDRTLQRPRAIQLYLAREDKGTCTQPPFYLEEERKRKSPWTCATPNSSRKIEARKQATMSTPITYSGTFAVNRELVPIGTSSPSTSPRSRKTSSRSEGSSPTRHGHDFVDLRQLGQISEEKISSAISSENCSLTKSNCGFYENLGMLPGSVVTDPENHLSYPLM